VARFQPDIFNMGFSTPNSQPEKGLGGDAANIKERRT